MYKVILNSSGNTNLCNMGHFDLMLMLFFVQDFSFDMFFVLWKQIEEIN